ncbi:hypothetical protein MKS88_000605 [Plasmodium brasilianum]|uniref:Uncharacterized protein n=1 Tax=Plasmodium brasilianum TaxID=5824 RepID=A0ACB9YH49_PLABR|nr:hypothetical protein MKS88_000605 [Plasmodium brasilianum]
MKQKIKFIIFIKIFLFLLLTWICNFNNDMWACSKFLDGNCKVGENLNTSNYRSLAKSKKDKYSNNVSLKENFLKNGVNKQKNISNNEKEDKEKNKQSNRGLLNKAQYYTEVIDYNNAMFDGKHFHFEKKWIKKKDYDHFLKRNRRICDISLNKIRFRKYGTGVAMFFIFILLGIGIPILSSLPSLKDIWEKIKKIDILSSLKAVDGWGDDVLTYLIIALFSVLMVTLAVMLIIGFYRILRNNEKYNKIKLINEKYE